MGLFQAALDTPLDSPFSATLSVHGLHFTVCVPSIHTVNECLNRIARIEFTTNGFALSALLTSQKTREGCGCFRGLFGGSRGKLQENPGKIAGKIFLKHEMLQILGFGALGKANLPGTLGRHCLNLVPTFRAGCFLKSTVPAFSSFSEQGFRLALGFAANLDCNELNSDCNAFKSPETKHYRCSRNQGAKLAPKTERTMKKKLSKLPIQCFHCPSALSLIMR